MAEMGTIYFVQIPTWIYEMDELNKTDILIYGELYTLGNTSQAIFPSNAYLMKRIRAKSKTTVSGSISKLTKLGLIDTAIKYKENGEVDKRFIKILPYQETGKGVPENWQQGYQETDRGLPENWQDNKSLNKSINKTVNKKILSGKPDVPPAQPTTKSEILEIVAYLNKVVGTKYTTKRAITIRHINARLAEGFTVDDFKQVIDTMNAKWGNDTKMAGYLRPDTLFGTKFENYLNANSPTEKKEIWYE